ncbi:MAG: hypothetical protein C4326_02820, partial [Ignavibacteria bacterium]
GRIPERVYECFPPLYDHWIEKAGLPQPPRAIAMNDAERTQPKQEREAISIIAPANGEVFTLDPLLRPQYQTVSVQPVVPRDVDGVALYVNGTRCAMLAPPYRYRLPLASLRKGSHTLVVKGRRGERAVESAPVVIAVQ